MSELAEYLKSAGHELKDMARETIGDIKNAESILERDRAISRLHFEKNEFDKEDLIDGIIYAFEESDDRDDFARAVIMELKSFGWNVKGKLSEWKV